MQKASVNILRGTLIIIGFIFAILLFWGWIIQSRAPLSCGNQFGKLLDENNGYIQFNILNQNPNEAYFQGEVFIYYPSSQDPPNNIVLTRSSSGRYARSVIKAKLVPWSRGKATAQPHSLTFPTPGKSHRQFPFDSPIFEFALAFEPTLQPKVILFRNFTDGFIMMCDTLSAQWNNSGNLNLRIEMRRNPIIQITVIVLSIAALAFGILLSKLKSTDSLATATASYFISLWSLRAIVAPAIHIFPTYFDLILLTITVFVLFMVFWRITGILKDRAMNI